MMIKDMLCIEQIVSKLYAVVDGRKKVVAEIVKKPGLGLEWLIRIDEKYKYQLNVFADCIMFCGINEEGLIIDKELIEKSIKQGYPINSLYQDIALVIDNLS